MRNVVALSMCLLFLPIAASYADETKFECVEATSITPFYFGGYLYVHVAATLPDGCYSVTHNWLESWPPQLAFSACKPVVDGQVCTQQIRYYEDWYVTKWGAGFSKLKVHFGTGKTKEYDVISISDVAALDDRIPIPLREHRESVASLLEDGFGPIPLKESFVKAPKATGISFGLSYDEAFKNALQNLQVETGSALIPHAVVVGVGYRNGFIGEYLYVVLAKMPTE